MDKHQLVKNLVIEIVMGTSLFHQNGKSTFSTKKHKIHIRYCSPQGITGNRYKFSIYPKTLEADFEVWICGCEDNYYLFPMKIISEIYKHPETSIDRRNRTARVVSIYTDSHELKYAPTKPAFSISKYHNSTIAIINDSTN